MLNPQPAVPTPIETTPLDTISAYLSADHARLDGLLSETARCVEDERFVEARDAFVGFESALCRHHRLEEELLFPVFEVRSGISDGPTVSLRLEHREIRHAVAQMRAALEADDAGGFRDAMRFLDALLTDHEAKEEHVLYPTTDLLLASGERTRFLARLRRE
jgi:hemerythrin superfamily protein